MIDGHDPEVEVCPGCGEKCVHAEFLLGEQPMPMILQTGEVVERVLKKRGPKPKPHARREKLTIYISKGLRLAIMKKHQTDNVSMVIAKILEDMFPDHKLEAERILRDANMNKEKENEE